jgi:hypothetical protein
MGSYGAYRDEARSIVEDLRKSGRLDEILNRRDPRTPAKEKVTEPAATSRSPLAANKSR